MRRRVKWVERPDVYLRGERCYAVADKANWQIDIDVAYHRSPRQILLTETHELGHLLFPDLPEKDVRKKFEFLAAELWRRGYRKER